MTRLSQITETNETEWEELVRSPERLCRCTDMSASGGHSIAPPNFRFFVGNEDIAWTSQNVGFSPKSDIGDSTLILAKLLGLPPMRWRGPLRQFRRLEAACDVAFANNQLK